MYSLFVDGNKITPRARHAFTLTELAIVLGVIGLILGAIWVAASQAYNGQKAQKAATQVLQILTGYRTLWGARGVDVADWTDVTCLGVNAGFFPSDMIQPGVTCATGNGYTYPSSPWGAAAGGQFVQVFGYHTWNGIIIAYEYLSQTACISFATSSATDPTIIWEDINVTAQGSGQSLGGSVWTTSQINQYCVAGNNNLVEVMYPAR